jgi:hypothetical protein
LAAILSSTVTPSGIARKLLTAAFLVVTVGALAATAKYDVVRMYRIPVIFLALTGLVGLAYRPAFALVKRRAG